MRGHCEIRIPAQSHYAFLLEGAGEEVGLQTGFQEKEARRIGAALRTALLRILKAPGKATRRARLEILFDCSEQSLSVEIHYPGRALQARHLATLKNEPVLPPRRKKGRPFLRSQKFARVVDLLDFGERDGGHPYVRFIKRLPKR